jgi:hypothetical protein
MRWLLLLVLAAGCFYSPDIRDCANTCSATQLCPEGLTCESGFCRTAGATGSCPQPDAQPGVDGPAQGDAPIDAQCPFDAGDAGCSIS